MSPPLLFLSNDAFLLTSSLQGLVRPSQGRRVVARRDDVGAGARRTALLGRARHAANHRPPAPARAPAGDPITIFSRFLAFMFSARCFKIGPGRAAQRACPLFCLCFSLSHLPINARRLISYGLHARARRLFGCWVSVRRSTSSSYFARVAISILKKQKIGTLLHISSLYPPSLRSHSSFVLVLLILLGPPPSNPLY